ncbi:hypothetical protein CLV98_101577 [Dyadobacter jejuensis]|uniref:CDP-glycerol glycerophosphotransferase (TagB/SpsB family) n=1 Tax=Dyadobacter jejuensis TaxID=1082580 RepID=A0A316ARR9_9BACT|nr:hypothetical protein [Dyadobacter jejuensis]PWJ60393.1 hypothetical protein CLV98_101577 [Dyadobacter jejuensis]
MIHDKEFTQYKELKELLKFNDHGIDFEKVLALDICTLTYQTELSLPQIFYSFFLSNSLIKPLVAGLLKPGILVIEANTRPEFASLLKQMLKDLSNYEIVPLSDHRISILPNIFLALASFAFVWKRTHKILPLTSIIYLSSRLTYYRTIAKAIIKELENKKINCHTLVSFNCQVRLEALFTQFANNQGLKTYTLTHGMSYTSYRKFIPVDALNGENVTANKILVWGESNKTDLSRNFGIDPSRILTAGNPLYPLQKINVQQSFRCAVILLGRKIYDNGNQNILKVAAELKKQYGIEFAVRLHPSLDAQFYSQYCHKLGLSLADSTIQLKEMLQKSEYDFAIVNNSTTYYESMYHNMICFRYEPDENDAFHGLDDKFTNASSLYDRITTFKNADPYILNNEVKFVLEENLGMGINRYREILEN